MSTMTSTRRTTLPALVVAGCAVLAACTAAPAATGPGTTSSTSLGAAPSGTGAAPSSAAAGDGPVGTEEVAVALALTNYQKNVAAGDFALACTQMTVESATALVTAVQNTGVAAPTCQDALAAVIAQPGAQEAAIEAANSIVVDEVIVEGLSATVSWTSERQGVARTDSLRMQNIDGQWRLAGPA